MIKASIRSGLVFLLAWFAIPAAASAQAPAVELQTPRAFGYFVGDVLQLDAIVTAPPSGRLSAASLPRPRTVRPWLDLRDASVEELPAGASASRYRLRLTYQLLDAPMEAAARVIPPLTVKIEGPGGLADAVIPAWTLLMSPLRGAQAGATGTPSVLMPDAVPQGVDSMRPVALMLAAFAGAAACLVLLAWHHAWWPLHRRPARPFTLAWREIGGRLSAMPGDTGYRGSLLALHRAFDAAAGRRVFAGDLNGFIDRHPQFRPLRHEIGQFFLASRRAFFADDVSGASEQHPMEALSSLSRKLSTLEREGA
jgi:mxaA protein